MGYYLFTFTLRPWPLEGRAWILSISVWDMGVGTGEGGLYSFHVPYITTEARYLIFSPEPFFNYKDLINSNKKRYTPLWIPGLRKTGMGKIANFSAGGWVIFGKLRLKLIKSSFSGAMPCLSKPARQISDKRNLQMLGAEKKHSHWGSFNHSFLPNWVKGNGVRLRKGKWAVIQLGGAATP